MFTSLGHLKSSCAEPTLLQTRLRSPSLPSSLHSSDHPHQWQPPRSCGTKASYKLITFPSVFTQTALTEGGPRKAAAVASQHFLHTQTLEALSEMRGQFASMLADVRFLQPPKGESSGGGGRGGGSSRWLDDSSRPWNRYSGQAAVVSVCVWVAHAAENVYMLCCQ